LETHVKYLCLIYIEEDKLEATPASECLAYAAALRESGYRVAAEALRFARTGTTVRVRNGEVSVTDGPFVETKEHLAGFYVVDVRDLNEAVRLVAKIPSAPAGRIELRPILDLGGSF
jgi:hypothetical protein